MADWEKKLTRARDAIDAAYTARDQTIRDAYAAGMKQGAIAESVGLSRMQVSRIINPKP